MSGEARESARHPARLAVELGCGILVYPLVGSYELLAWIIRTAAAGAPDHVPAADHHGPPSDQPGTGPCSAAGQAPDAGPGSRPGQVIRPAPASGEGPQALVPAAGADQRPGPGLNVPDHADQIPGYPPKVSTASEGRDINAAAVAAYRASVQSGQPISERKLAEMFGTTSRRWARNRMAEARRNPVPA